MGTVASCRQCTGRFAARCVRPPHGVHPRPDARRPGGDVHPRSRRAREQRAAAARPQDAAVDLTCGRCRRIACLPAEPDASPGVLAEESIEALERRRGRARPRVRRRGAPARAAPRGRARRAAPTRSRRSGRDDEARVAYARALAIEPDDPRRAPRRRRALTCGGSCCDRRGRSSPASSTRAAARPRARRCRSDRRARRPARARRGHGARTTSAGAASPSRTSTAPLQRGRDDPDAIYESGVALYELCRFDDAQRAFERALALAPDDAWTLHQLGLVAERTRRGSRRATSLLRPRPGARARRLQAGARRSTADAFRAEVEAAVAGAAGARAARARGGADRDPGPPRRRRISSPSHPPLSPSILGLFRGPSEDEPCTAADGPRCRSIVVLPEEPRSASRGIAASSPSRCG